MSGDATTGQNSEFTKPARKKTVTKKKAQYVALTIPDLGPDSLAPRIVEVGCYVGQFILPRGVRVIVPEVVVNNLRAATVTKFHKKPKLVGVATADLPDGVPMHDFEEEERRLYPSLDVEELTEEEAEKAEEISATWMVKKRQL